MANFITKESTENEKWEFFEYCHKHNIPIHGTITEYHFRFGYTVDFYGVHAEMHRFDISSARIYDYDFFVNKQADFMILNCNKVRHKLVVSRRRIAESYRTDDIVDGIITKVLNNRINVDCGCPITIHIRDLADFFISDISQRFTIGKNIKLALKEDFQAHLTIPAIAKQSIIWKIQSQGLKKDDIVTVSCRERLENGLIVYVNRHLNEFISYEFLSAEYKELFDNNVITFDQKIDVAVSKVNNDYKRILFNMRKIEKLEKRRFKEVLKQILELGTIVEATVTKVTRKKAKIRIDGTKYECDVQREDLSPNKTINAQDEVFVGERIKVVYVGEDDQSGNLVFKRNLIMQDRYDASLYRLPINELLDHMGIHSERFIGKAIKIGKISFFTNVITKDKDELENGKLLIDPQIGRPVLVLAPYNENLEEGDYYEFGIKLPINNKREAEGTPYMFSTSGDLIQCNNPYKEIVSLMFKQHTSPNTNTSIANLLEEVGQNLYTSKKRMFFELLQNADDAAPEEGVKIKIQIIGDFFVVTHDGFAFNQHDFESITSAAKSTKSANQRKTGYKGIGFKSVFTNSQSVLIKSRGFNFAFDKSLDAYNDFEKFYFFVNDIEDLQDKQQEFLHKYSKYHREFRGVKDIPWQLLPIWHDGLSIEPEESIFNKDENVAIALKMDKVTLSEYGEAVLEVFNQPRFMLFLRNTQRIQFLVDGEPMTIQKDIDKKQGIISLFNTFSDESNYQEDYKIVTVENINVDDNAFAEAQVYMRRKERTNNRGEKENYFERFDKSGSSINEVSGIPDRIASATSTSIAFALPLSNGKIIPSSTVESSLYAYLPMNEHRFNFPFFINADFIPKSDREGVQSDNPWNHFLFYTIGKNIVSMVANLASVSEPNYLNLLLRSRFEYNSQDTASLVESFNLGYFGALYSTPLIINDEGKLAMTKDVVLDASGLHDAISPNAFYALTNETKRLPHPNIDSSILKEDIFDVGTLSIRDVTGILENNIDNVNNWIAAAPDDQRTKFFDWVKSNDETSSLVSQIAAFTFGDEWHSMQDIKSNGKLIIMTDQILPIKDVLKSLGYYCSDQSIEYHQFGDKFEKTIKKSSFNKTIKALETNVDTLNKWIENTADDQRLSFFEWIKANDEASSLVNQIAIFTFGGKWHSLQEVKEEDKFILMIEKSLPVKDVLRSIDYNCSDQTIEGHILEEEFEKTIVKTSFVKVLNALESNIEGLNRWIENATNEQRISFFEWIKVNDETSTLVNRISTFTFDGKWHSLQEVKDKDKFVLLSKKTRPIKDILIKLGFSCSDQVLEGHQLEDVLEKQDDKKLFDVISTCDFSCLTSEERIELFHCLKEFDGVNKTSLKKIPLFKNGINEFKALDLMVNFREDAPAWLRPYMLNENDIFEDIESYLISDDQEFSKIIRNHYDEIDASLENLYNLYKKQWNGEFTQSLMLNNSLEAILPIVEESDTSTKQFFLDTINKIDLSSSKSYNKESFEYRVICIAISVLDEPSTFSSKIFFDGTCITEFSIKDEVICEYKQGRELKKVKMSLARILPEYQNISDAIANIKNLFEKKEGIDKLFKAKAKPLKEIIRELQSGSLQLKAGAWPTDRQGNIYQYLFYVFYYREIMNSDSYYVLSLNLEAETVGFINELMDFLLANRIDIKKSPFTFRIISYFEEKSLSNDFIFDDEKILPVIENWADNLEKIEYLKSNGVKDESHPSINCRKRFLENQSINFIEDLSTSDLARFMEFITMKSPDLLPFSGKNQQEILLNLLKKRSCAIQDSWNLEKIMQEAKEWDVNEYDNWSKKGSPVIFIYSGHFPKQLHHNETLIANYLDESTDYLKVGANKLFISDARKIEDVLFEMAKDEKINLDFEDYHYLVVGKFMSSSEEIEVKENQINELKKQLEEERQLRLKQNEDIEEYKERGATITKGSDQGLSLSQKWEAQLEAQLFLMQEMPSWEFPEGYGECDERGAPKHQSTSYAIDKNSNIIRFVLKSYKKDNEPFRVNTNEWSEMMNGAQLFIYRGSKKGIVKIEPKDLIRNQSNITITFSTDNFDYENRISALADALHYFKELHFDFESFNISKRAQSIKEIYNKVSGVQRQTTDDDL